MLHLSVERMYLDLVNPDDDDDDIADDIADDDDDDDDVCRDMMTRWIVLRAT